MSPETWWYLTRASGIVAWLLLLAGFLWGVLLVSRLLGPHPRPAWMLDLHRWLGGLAVVFTGIHLGALIADSYVHFDLFDVLIPFASDWKPGAVAFGVFGLWLMVAVEATSLAMRRMPRRWWRTVHLSSYGLLWVSTMHGVMAGTDAQNPVLQASLIVLVTLAVVVVSHRVVRGAGGPRRKLATKPDARPEAAAKKVAA